MTDDTGTDPQDGKAAADAADDAARDAARDGAGGVAEESENDEDATAAAGEDAKVVVDVAEDEAGAEIIVEGGGGGESERLAEIRDQLLRAMAETENIRNRARREVEDATKYAVANFARDMLAVGDNLARGIESVPEGAAEDDTALTALIEGVAMTQRELLAAFERHGIKSIEPLGEKFDHNFHQAMFEVEDAASEPGTIIKVLQPGYLIAAGAENLARQTAARARTLLRRAAHAIVRRRAQRTQQQDNKEDRNGRGMGEATNTIVRRVRLHRNLWLAKTDPGFAWWRN